MPERTNLNQLREDLGLEHAAKFGTVSGFVEVDPGDLLALIDVAEAALQLDAYLLKTDPDDRWDDAGATQRLRQTLARFDVT